MTQSYAGFWQRTFAFLLDYIIIALYLGALIMLSFAVRAAFPAVLQALFGNPLTGQITGFFTVTLPVTLYFAFLESSAWQATRGKRRLHLKVVNTNGERLNRARALGRTALKFLPWELAHTCIWQISFASSEPSPLITAGFVLVWLLVGANIVSLWLSPERQTLYDRLARTCVVGS